MDQRACLMHRAFRWRKPLGPEAGGGITRLCPGSSVQCSLIPGAQHLYRTASNMRTGSRGCTPMNWSASRFHPGKCGRTTEHSVSAIQAVPSSHAWEHGRTPGARPDKCDVKQEESGFVCFCSIVVENLVALSPDPPKTARTHQESST